MNNRKLGTEKAASCARDIENDGGRSLAIVVYVLYLLIFLAGITAIIGVIIAHFKIAEADELHKTHFRYQIRTFWIGLAYVAIGAIMMLLLIGYLLVPLAGLWFLIRCIKGLVRLSDKKPIDEPLTWLW